MRANLITEPKLLNQANESKRVNQNRWGWGIKGFKINESNPVKQISLDLGD